KKNGQQVEKGNKSKSLKASIDVKNNSLLKNPPNGGSPAIDIEPINATVKLNGIILINPPNLRISLVPVSWSTIPAIINKLPLKTAWFNKWKRPAKPATLNKVVSAFT